MEEDAAGSGAAGDGVAPGGRVPSAKRGRPAVTTGGGGGSEMVPWGQPPAPGQRQQVAGAASRICRVKATGGKDRHSKVYTSKGVRDRRVRLSVPTAIQFYDLQDRLGFDQPSKAVEWLINAASAAIDELPPLDPAAFAAMPDAQQQQARTRAGKRPQKQPQQQQGSRSWCSSTSDTSKGSELSLSRSDGRGGGAGASRDKEVTVASASPAQAAASFTELLTGPGPAGAADHRQTSWQQQHQKPVSAVTAHAGKAAAQVVPTYPGIRFGNAPPVGMVPAQPFNFNFATSAQMTHFSLVHDAMAPAPAPAPAGDYSLDFSMSSGFLGASNRGTLQSNSHSHFSNHHQHNHQQLQGLDDGPSPPFLYDQNAATVAAHPSSDNNHLTATAALQLWNGFRHSAMKEKTKN